MKHQTISNFFGIVRSLVFIIILVGFSACQTGWEVNNPYQGVNWKKDTQFKGNFHTHTLMSDGWMNPQTAVDSYHKLGYKILAITDHNRVTFPWENFAGLEPGDRAKQRVESGDIAAEDLVFENRDPSALGMIAIQGNELSRHHHIGSYFSDLNGTDTEEAALEATAAKNGLAILNHPGRYHDRNPEIYNLDWYLDHFHRFNHLIGMEVYNQADRYSNDRLLWDSILVRMMPERNVWGFSNDDMHHPTSLGINWNVFVLPELSDNLVRKGMEEGLFYFIYAPKGHDGPPPPGITSINVSSKKGMIKIETSACDSIHWISGGRVLHNGYSINLNELDEIPVYVRAKLYGSEGSLAGTQAFGISKL